MLIHPINSTFAGQPFGAGSGPVYGDVFLIVMVCEHEAVLPPLSVTVNILVITP